MDEATRCRSAMLCGKAMLALGISAQINAGVAQAITQGRSVDSAIPLKQTDVTRAALYASDTDGVVPEAMRLHTAVLALLDSDTAMYRALDEGDVDALAQRVASSVEDARVTEMVGRCLVVQLMAANP